MSNPVAVATGRANVLKRHRPPGHPDIADAERDLRAAKLIEHVRRVVDQAPPLTPEQRDRIAALLRPVADQGSAA